MYELDGIDPAPEPGDFVRVDPKEVVGHLLLVWTIDYIEHSPTRFSQPGKKSDVIVVDAVDLDQRDPDTQQVGLVGRRCWWRQAQLIRDLKGSIGRPNPKLCYMDRGQATKGQPPYVIRDARYDQNAVARAHAWLQANPGFKPSDPSGAPIPSTPPQPVQLPPETQLEAMARRAQAQVQTMGQGYPLPGGGVTQYNQHPSTPSLPQPPPLPDTPPF